MKVTVRFRSLLNLGRTLSLFVVLAVLLLMTNTSQAQNPITVRYTADGHYATVAAGVGLDGLTTGDIVLNVPGTPIAAYLYWSGFAPAGGADSVITLDVNSTQVSTDVYADAAGLGLDAVTFGPNLWYGSYFRTVFVADVTRFVQTGNATYTVSDFIMTGAGARQDGAGLVVVYENASVPLNRVIIQDGLSIFFPTSNPPQTFRHSDTACLDFPSDTIARNLNYSLFVGGLVDETPPTPPRTNALWSYTGAGTSLHNEVPARNIIDVVDPTNPLLGSQAPIAGAQPVSGVNPADQNEPDTTAPTFGNNNPPDVFNGDQWDTYTSTLNIPSGDTFACFQVQTFYYNGSTQFGSSGNWMALIGSIPLPATPTPPTPPTPVPTTVSGGNTPVPGSADPIVSKIPNPQNVVPGEQVTWTVTITNPNSGAMNNVRVTDPVDVSFFSAIISASAANSAITATVNGLSVIYDIPVIQPGETLTLTLVVRTRADLAPGTVGTNFVIVERPGRPPFQSAPVSLSMIRRLPSTGYPPR